MKHVATVLVPAPASAVFAVLRDPAAHGRFDGSDMVGAPETPALLSAVGQVFTMHMTWTDGTTVERYRSDNHVTEYSPDRAIAWATAVHGGSPLGWTWRYELEPVDEGTQVQFTYDWTGTSAENIRHFGVPIVGRDQLAESLRRLAAICT